MERKQGQSRSSSGAQKRAVNKPANKSEETTVEILDDEMFENEPEISKIDKTFIEIRNISSEILEKFKNDEIVPTPENYAYFFRHILEQKDELVKMEIAEIINESMCPTMSIEREMAITKNALITSELLRAISKLYGDVKSLSATTKKAIDDLKKAKSTLETNQLLQTMADTIDLSMSVINNNAKALKQLHSQSVEKLKKIDSTTVYNTTFGLYNRHYTNRILKKEAKSHQRYGTSSYFLRIQPTDESLSNMQTNNEINALYKAFSMVLKRIANKSHILSYLGNGVFSIIMPHTDYVDAIKIEDEILYAIGSGYLIIRGKEMRLKAKTTLEKIGNTCSKNNTEEVA